MNVNAKLKVLAVIVTGFLASCGQSVPTVSQESPTPTASTADTKASDNLLAAQNLSRGVYTIRTSVFASSTTKCLDNGYGKTAYLFDYHGQAAQDWRYDSTTKQITTPIGCFDTGLQTNAGAYPYIHTCNASNSAQKFDFVPVAGQASTFLIRGYGNQCLDTSFNRTNGFRPYLFTCNSNNKAQWWDVSARNFAATYWSELSTVFANQPYTILSSELNGGADYRVTIRGSYQQPTGATVRSTNAATIFARTENSSNYTQIGACPLTTRGGVSNGVVSYTSTCDFTTWSNTKYQIRFQGNYDGANPLSLEFTIGGR